MVWLARLLPLVILFLAVPAEIVAQTYGSGGLEYRGVRLQFFGQVSSSGTCQQTAQNLIQCRIPAGTSGTIQLTTSRTPPGAVNIRAVFLPLGWPAFTVASGWGTVNKTYSFTVPSGSAGQRFELHFSAWTAGVIGELQLTFIIDAVTPSPPTPSPPYTEPAPTLVPKIDVVPDVLDFGTVAVGEQATAPLPVTFAPTEAGDFKDRVIVVSNGPQRPQVEISLTGRGYKKLPVSCPEGPAPSNEDGTVPPPAYVKEEYKECPLGVLTQNCQLIPGITAFYRGTPHAAERAKEIGKLAAGEWAQKYHVICLQEVFSKEGKDFSYKNAVAREWLKDEKVDLGAEKEPGAGKERKKVKKWWHKLEKDGTHQDREIELDGEKIQLLARNPVERSAVPQIAVLKKGDNYLVAGPDSSEPGKFTVDSGLMILSRYPLIAASGFTFSQQYGKWESRSNKGALYARIKLPSEPECFLHVFTTHLAAGEEEEVWEGRQEQLKELGEFIKKCVADAKGNPVIVCGDFNVDGYCGEYNRLMVWAKPFNLKDAWRGKNPRTDPPKSPYDDPKKDIPWRERQLSLEKRREYERWERAHRDYKNECTKYLSEGKYEATWVGKESLKEEAPWGGRNVLATEGGGYQRLDYILYVAGSTPLMLKLESICREPVQRRAEKYPWGGYTVSDHLGLGAQFKAVPAEAGK